MNRRLMLGIVGGLMVVLLAYAGATALHSHPVKPAAAASAVPSVMGGPIHLVDQDGRAVDGRDLQGKPSLLFFGFTYCPDVCPTTLAKLTAWMKALGPDADRINVAFVTVDPERDTPRQMKLYLSSFDPRIRGFTGSPQAVADAAHEFNVYYQKVALDGGGYTMDHSSGIYLLDRQGRLAEQLSADEDTPDALASVKRALSS